MGQLIRWFAPPVFEGEKEKTWHAALLNSAQLVIITMFLMIIIGHLVGDKLNTIVLAIDGITIGIMLLLRLLLFRGKVYLSGILSIIVGITLLTVGQALLGTIRTPTTAMFMLVIIVAGQLFDRKGFILSTVVSSIAILGLILAENASLLPEPDFAVNITQWISYTFMFGLTAQLTHYSFHKTANTLKATIAQSEELEKAHSQLKASKKYLNNIINAIGDPVFVKDDEYRFILANDSLCEILGIERENIIGKTLGESLPDNQMKHFLKIDKMVLESGLDNLTEELLTGRGGNILTIVTKKTRYVDEQGNKFIVGTIRDITERKLAEEVLLDSRERYLSLFDNMLDGIYRSTPEGKFVDVNPAMVNMFGYSSSEEMLQVDIRKELYFAPEERGSHVLDTGHEEIEVYRMRRKDGSEIWVEDHGHYVHDEQGRIAYHEGLLRDITDRKQAEGVLAESNSLRELLLDIITHDLRNPAGVIYALSEGARKGEPENRILDSIFTTSGRLLNVLDNTTTLAQATFGEDIPMEELSLNDMLTTIVDEFSIHWTENDMDLKMEIPLDTMISANPLIAEVFKNYISNAIKYARDGKRIVVETVIEDQAVVVCVKDFGKTIAKADRERIFERRAQLEDGKEKGRGLGLAIVKRIALAHDGKAWVEPNTPQGNSFCVRIPV